MINNLFTPLLVILILTLALKASMLFDKVQEHAGYTLNTSAKSVLVDSAYATSSSTTTDTLNQNPIKQEPPNTQAPKSTVNPPFLVKPAQLSAKSEAGTPVAQMYNASEVQLLKELSKRREELDKASVDIKVKEKILKATEDKINQKLLQLKAMQDRIDEVMKQYDEKERVKIISLVKIYENMKPKDAAKIFDELDMSVLIQVISNMKEVRAAPVIASMNPIKARDLSIELAKQKSVMN